MGQSLCGFLDHVVVDQVVIVQPGRSPLEMGLVTPTRPCVWAAVVWALWHTCPGRGGDVNSAHGNQGRRLTIEAAIAL